MITTKGEYKMVTGDASAEFKLDKNDFFEKILDIYYNKTNNRIGFIIKNI